MLYGCTKKEYVYVQQSERKPATAQLDYKTIQIIADTGFVSWDLKGKTILFSMGKITHGTLLNADIDASVNQVIFDTSVNLVNCTTAKTPYSSIWLGLSVANADNWWIIQKSINMCAENNLVCYTPARNGGYKYSKTISSAKKDATGKYIQTSINILGDASYWTRGTSVGTTFIYTGLEGPAINFQLNKGSKMKGITFVGQYKVPGGSDSAFFNLTEQQFTDQSGLGLPDNYTGVAIDYYYDGLSRSGSTGIEMEDISINNFANGLSFSANGITQNDEAHVIDKLHFNDCKRCIVTGQPQEKGTSIDHIYTWGSCYNVLKHFGAGDYSFTDANIAGRCIEPVQGSIGRWFSCYITHWYSERVMRVCTVSALQPFVFRDCNFDLIFTGGITKQRIVIYSNSTYVKFENCNFRYYDGIGGDIWIRGAAAFENCNYYFGNLVYK